MNGREFECTCGHRCPARNVRPTLNGDLACPWCGKLYASMRDVIAREVEYTAKTHEVAMTELEWLTLKSAAEYLRRDGFEKSANMLAAMHCRAKPKNQ